MLIVVVLVGVAADVEVLVVEEEEAEPRTDIGRGGRKALLAGGGVGMGS